MEKLTLHHTAICRSPAFPITAILPEVWEDLKVKIQESSPDFYKVIENTNPSAFDQLEGKVRFTIWKYFTRGKYRATPFGTFAAITPIPVERIPVAEPILEKEMHVASFPDWTEKQNAQKSSLPVNWEEIKLIRNSSIYLLGGQIRYLRSSLGNFELATVAQQAELNALIAACEVQQTPLQLAAILKRRLKTTKKNAFAWIGQMIEAELLLPEHTPNIIGEDYFSRIGYRITSQKVPYQIASRGLHQGALDGRLLKNVPAMVHFLAGHLPEQPPNELEEFMREFHKKFEGKEIPLSQVMDPEVGIGYGQLETPLYQPLLLLLKEEHHLHSPSQQLSYTPFLQFLLQKIIQGATIQLEDYQGGAVPTRSVLPNSLSIIYRLHQGRPVIESAGGVSATAILGRFSHGSAALDELNKETALFEGECNPEVLFFDIGYQAENQVDNVNRRQQIYPLELPILTWSTNAQPLEVDDIQVSVHRQQVYLRSRKLNKRLVPRIPSAYNFNRSDLALFRFLCHLQAQHLKTNFNFHPRTYFPGLDQYPRTRYKDLILSPQTWKVPVGILLKSTGKSSSQQLAELSNWLQEKGINELFRAGETDNTLCFDPSSKADLEHFLSYCQQQSGKEIYLYEALLGNQTQLKDNRGDPYAGQYIVSYRHTDPIYRQWESPVHRQAPNHFGIHTPGGEWLYYKLYFYPTQANAVLTGPLHQFLITVKPYLSTWFFIRYDSPAPHLRLRLGLKNPRDFLTVNQALKVLIEPEINSGQLADLTLATYKQELHRYGADRIKRIERVFHLDSKLVLGELRRRLTPEQHYLRAVEYILKVYLRFLGNRQHQLAFVSQMAQQFAQEHHLAPVHFRALNQAYQQDYSGLDPWDTYPSSARTAAGYKVVHKAVEKALLGATGPHLQQLIADLIHMHLNRRFPADQRLQETVVYHYLQRYLRAHGEEPARPTEREERP